MRTLAAAAPITCDVLWASAPSAASAKRQRALQRRARQWL